MRLGFLILSMSSMIAIAGCGDLARGKVHGSIKFKGEPLKNSTVMFMTRDNQIYRAETKEDGSYEVEGVPLGPVKVCVQQALPSVTPRPDATPGQTAAAKAAMGEKRDQKWQPPPSATPEQGEGRLPTKYGDPNQSGLSFEMTSADQEWSTNLE